MLNWVLDETKPSAHVQHPWKSIHPHNVFHNARETFDMSYLGLNKWNRTKTTLTRASTRVVSSLPCTCMMYSLFSIIILTY